MSSKIYTKAGDKGLTGLFGQSKVSKTDIRVEAYGTIDELNSFIGLLRDGIVDERIRQELMKIQHELFNLGSHMATVDKMRDKLPPIDKNIVADLEQIIDRMETELPSLKNFIISGGAVSVSRCHICRTVCRRAERRVVAAQQVSSNLEEILIILNRLSDYFFVLARYLALSMGIKDVEWITD